MAVTAALAIVAGCGKENTYVAPPPPKVDVAVPLNQPVTRYLEATGTTAAVNMVDLVARVQGFIETISYRDGDQVKKGTVLFTIEPEPYRLKLEQAKAAQTAAEATVTQTQAEFDRQSDLATRQIASKSTLDNARANRDSAVAKLQQAKTDTETAALNLGYTQVKAPFDGVVTARKVSVGELVGVGTPTVLATIVQRAPIYVNFTISEVDVLHIRQEMARRGLTPADIKKVPVEVGLQTETGYPHRGTLDYASPTVDASTGTLAARAVLENEKNVLLPGYFVRLRIPLGEAKPALLVPDDALGSDQGGRYLLVVNKDNVVEQHKVEIGPVRGTMRVVENGIKPDDRVVIAGVQRAIPGQKVDPQTRELK